MAKEVLDDVNVDGMTRQQRRLARRTAWRLTTAPQRQAHREDMVEMRAAQRRAVNNGTLKRQYPGRRGGRRVRLVWADEATLDQWRTRYRGIPRTRRRRFTIRIGSCAFENPGDEQTPGSGRMYTEIQADEREQHWLHSNNVLICYPGTFDEIPDDEEETP